MFVFIISWSVAFAASLSYSTPLIEIVQLQLKSVSSNKIIANHTWIYNFSYLAIFHFHKGNNLHLFYLGDMGEISAW